MQILAAFRVRAVAASVLVVVDPQQDRKAPAGDCSGCTVTVEQRASGRGVAIVPRNRRQRLSGQTR